MKTLTATEKIFADYKRTAPRLDLEFLVAHTRTVPMPYALLQACQAAHAAMVKDEPTARNHGKHRATVAALTSQYWQHRRAKIGTVAFFAPLFTPEEYAAIACIDDPDRAFDEACMLDADYAYGYAERMTIAEATAAYAYACMHGYKLATLAEIDRYCARVAA